MSAINGDKARFNRDRKSKIARRARNRKRFSGVREQSKSTPRAAQSAKVSL
jgi:hypothetical protein